MPQPFLHLCTICVAGRGDGKWQIKKLSVNDSNDDIHPCALLPNGLSMIENCGVGNIPCRLQNSQHVLLLVSDKVSLVCIIVPNKNLLLSQTSFQHHHTFLIHITAVQKYL